jgi:pimeloyl-ACP methyl ester carboxylesterase
MIDRDSVETRKLWLDGLTSGGKRLAKGELVTSRDVRLVWYADVLDPRSGAGCSYDAGDARARRDSKTDPELKGFVSLVGNFVGALTSMVADNESATQLRALAGDASFLSDASKRCASERRLGDAIERARREGRPVILVAHSLGSVVAYDYLSTRTDTGIVQRLVTVGSMLGSDELRRLLIGGDSTDAFALPASVKSWFNVRNTGDMLAVQMPFGRDILTTGPSDEPDQHEMVSYLRGEAGAGVILSGWCEAFVGKRPSACARWGGAER